MPRWGAGLVGIKLVGGSTGLLWNPPFLCRDLLKLFVEIHYWDRLLFEIPHYVAEVYERREDLRVLRENLLLVARDYNRFAGLAFLGCLSPASFPELRQWACSGDWAMEPGTFEVPEAAAFHCPF